MYIYIYIGIQYFNGSKNHCLLKAIPVHEKTYMSWIYCNFFNYNFRILIHLASLSSFNLSVSSSQIPVSSILKKPLRLPEDIFEQKEKGNKTYPAGCPFKSYISLSLLWLIIHLHLLARLRPPPWINIPAPGGLASAASSPEASMGVFFSSSSSFFS